MRARWLPVGILALVLFAVNVASRLVVRLAFDGGAVAENRASLVMFAVIATVLGVLAFVRARREPVARWLGDLSVAAGVALVLTLFVGPFVSGGTPFGSGAGDFFNQIWLYAGFAGAGMLIGYLLVTALGLDYRSQGLKRYAEARMTRPRRIVRR
ncbi:hypothetical protein [Spirilliplanes yamanashiensis]|uniref:Uncharacterized protein n=1 Tax=Spirilliplanes yamanashiensis TaxID=42233 RepID=A0A8J3Y3U2_9ACTN|nr:hypothetical protein [Spirilliplanes yamanashiensis]MDP9814056.1 hypothetical protein [Spirilliplanes yamanashiensis]GIJ00964.1 hypothetical protein Sya03_03160 [Spirilliplanes yamanashiensis]